MFAAVFRTAAPDNVYNHPNDRALTWEAFLHRSTIRSISGTQRFDIVFRFAPLIVATTSRFSCRGSRTALKREAWRAIMFTVGGKSGVGKSTLVNKLVRREVFRADDVWACTTHAQSVFLNLDPKPDCGRLDYGVLLTDLPGLADGTSASHAYDALYRSWTKASGAFLYVIRADDRALESDEQAVEPLVQTGRLVVGISQVDRIKPHREWCPGSHRPSQAQRKHIAEKIDQVASTFRISTANVIPFSAAENYGLEPLMAAVQDRLG